MADFLYTTTQLSTEKLKEFNEYHEKEFENKRIKTRRIINYKYTDDNKPEFLNNILSYAADLLISNLGVTNLDLYKNVVEFHQLNLFADSKIKTFSWHRDVGIIYPFLTTYTVIFYLRKDKTVKGGNLNIRPYNKVLWFNQKSVEIPVFNSQVIMFDGSMEHKPQSSSGFGCRDAIVVFFHKL